MLPNEDTALLRPILLADQKINQTVQWHENSYIASYILVVVHSALDSMSRRESIRQTWARDQSPSLPIKVIFILGTRNSSENVQRDQKIKAESIKHQDILQEDFLDSYANLTLKVNYKENSLFLKSACKHTEKLFMQHTTKCR